MDTIETQLQTFQTKSAKIRFLDEAGWSRSDIAKKLGIRYQHVRNVLVRGKEQRSPLSPLLEKLHKIAEAEGRHPQSVLDEALRDFIEKKRSGGPRPEVMAAYRDSLKEFDALYRKLAK